MASDTARRAGELHRGVAEEIGVLLFRRRMTALDLARRLGLSQSAMSRRMVGDQPFDLDEIQRIAEALGVPVVDLLPRSARGDRANVSVGSPGHAPALASFPGVPFVPLPQGPLADSHPGRGWQRRPQLTGRRDTVSSV